MEAGVNNPTGAAFAIVGTAVTRAYEVNTAWNATLTVDGNSGLRVNCVGASGQTVRWTAFVKILSYDSL
jgi:hypothetical protein